MKKIISAALAGCMLLGAIPAVAADINIKIDNEEFIPKNALGEVVMPFIENGSTYLPVRAMGEAVGKAVAFDTENYAVYIGEEPLDSEKTREPVMMVDGEVIYKDELEDFSAYDFITMVKVIKLAESKFTEEEINKAYEEVVSWFNDEQAAEYADYYYYTACSELLENTVPVGCADYEKYVTAQHILVSDEETALEIIDELHGGALFEDLIEEYNLDPGQAKDSSYTFTYGEMVEEFEKAAFALEVEKYTEEPVKSDFGYHVIKRLPLDEAYADAHYYQNFYLPLEIESTECDVINLEGYGDYGKINGVTYNAEMLKKVNKLFTGDDTYVLYSEAFEYASVVAMINRLARNIGLVEDNSKEFNLDYELMLFASLYEAMFDGNVIGDDSDAEKAFGETEIEVFRKLKVYVDGKLVVPCDVNGNYVEPKNVDGTTYVPVRAIVEALSMKADWDNDTRTVVITK